MASLWLDYSPGIHNASRRRFQSYERNIGHATVSSFLQCLQRLDAITKVDWRKNGFKFWQMIHFDIKDGVWHLFKCIQVLKIKISHYLEDRLTVNDSMCKPRDNHFRYQIQLQPISFTALFSRGHSNLVKICFVTIMPRFDHRQKLPSPQHHDCQMSACCR